MKKGNKNLSLTGLRKLGNKAQKDFTLLMLYDANQYELSKSLEKQLKTASVRIKKVAKIYGLSL